MYLFIVSSILQILLSDILYLSALVFNYNQLSTDRFIHKSFLFFLSYSGKIYKLKLSKKLSTVLIFLRLFPFRVVISSTILRQIILKFSSHPETSDSRLKRIKMRIGVVRNVNRNENENEGVEREEERIVLLCRFPLARARLAAFIAPKAFFSHPRRGPRWQTVFH